MLARLLRRLMLAVALTALGWVMWQWQQAHRGAAIVGAALLLSVHAWILAFEFSMMAWINRGDPAPRAGARQVLHAWWSEVVTFGIVFGWYQTWRCGALPDTAASGTAAAHRRRGIVLVHGFMSNRGVWLPWFKRLRQAGVPYASVNLEPVFTAIDTYAPLLEASVRRVEQATGLPPVLVCHSMGGLVVRAWLRWQAARGGSESRVQRVITIGSPHGGTWMGRVSFAPNARQARTGSPWLDELARSEPAIRRERFTCFYSNCDNMVFPASTAALPGALAVHVSGVAHVDLAYHPQVIDTALRWTENTGSAVMA